MTKLETALQHALAVWRTELGHAADGVHPRLTEAEVAARQVTVVVRYSGDIEALRQAGLQTGFDSGGVVSGSIALADVERLDEVPGVESIALQPQVRPTLDNTVKELRVPWKSAPPNPPPPRGEGVIVAVIDTGIDIFHESFRTDDVKTTRILEFWDQTPTAVGTKPPAAFLQIGRVYSKTDIDAALTAGPPFTSVDTDGHGTHVAGIAAGDGSQGDRCSGSGTYVGVAPRADLVIVKAIGVTGASIRDAMQWCAQAGTRLQGTDPHPRPVVMNCSFGNDIGPHDGTDALDGFVDEILRPAAGPPAGIAIVVAAGNAGRGDIHESGTVPANGTVTVPFFIPEGSKKADLLDIWYTGAAALTVQLTAPANPSRPGSNTTGPIPPGAPGAVGSPAGTYPIGAMTLNVTSSTAPEAAHSNNRHVSVTISVPANTEVRSGVWQLQFTNTTAVPAVWNAWFQSQHGDSYPTFQQVGEDSPVDRRRLNTINAPGMSRNAITVANYDDSESRLADSSSRGSPTQAVAPSGEIKPTVAAPGMRVTAPRSQNSTESNSSCCDQLVVDKNGTSMASPHVAGVVALMFQRNRMLTFEQARAHLQVSARIDGIPAAEVPPVIEAATGIRGNHLWGSGKVDATAAIAGIPVLPAFASGSGGGAPLSFALDEIGLTPHTVTSRLADLQRRFGARPGLQLFAALVSEHVDEALRLVNTNRRVLIVWRRLGGPQLVRKLLHGPPPNETLLPVAVDGHDVAELLAGFTEVLDRFAGVRLREDLARFADFVRLWPGAGMDLLDSAALGYGTGR